MWWSLKKYLLDKWTGQIHVLLVNRWLSFMSWFRLFPSCDSIFPWSLVICIWLVVRKEAGSSLGTTSKSKGAWKMCMVQLCAQKKKGLDLVENGMVYKVVLIHQHVYMLLCLTPCKPMYCSLPDSSVHGIFHARILECVAISFSRGSSRSRGQTHVSCIGGWILYHWTTWEAQYWY